MDDQVSKEETLEKPAKIQKLEVDSVCSTIESFQG